MNDKYQGIKKALKIQGFLKNSVEVMGIEPTTS